MIDLPNLIQWKYGEVADTRNNEITAWRHPTIPQPTPEQLEIDAAEYAQHLKAQRKVDAIDRLWQNATEWENKFISGSAPTEVRFEAASGNTKAQEICQWVRQLWASYYDEKAWIEQQEELPEDYVVPDFSAHGPIPYSVHETLYGAP